MTTESRANTNKSCSNFEGDKPNFNETLELTQSIELLIRQNNKLNAHNLELLRQQESMQAEMKNVQQTLERLSAVTNYTPLPLRTAKLSDHFNVLNRRPLFKKQNTHVANSLQA